MTTLFKAFEHPNRRFVIIRKQFVVRPINAGIQVFEAMITVSSVTEAEFDEPGEREELQLIHWSATKSNSKTWEVAVISVNDLDERLKVKTQLRYQFSTPSKAMRVRELVVIRSKVS